MGNLLENAKLCGRTTVFISRASFWKRACQCLAKRPTLLEPPRQKILPRPLFWPSAEQCLRQFQEWPFCPVGKRKNRWEKEKPYLYQSKHLTYLHTIFMLPFYFDPYLLVKVCGLFFFSHSFFNFSCNNQVSTSSK